MANHLPNHLQDDTHCRPQYNRCAILVECDPRMCAPVHESCGCFVHTSELVRRPSRYSRTWMCTQTCRYGDGLALTRSATAGAVWLVYTGHGDIRRRLTRDVTARYTPALRLHRTQSDRGQRHHNRVIQFYNAAAGILRRRRGLSDGYFVAKTETQGWFCACREKWLHQNASPA